MKNLQKEKKEELLSSFTCEKKNECYPILQDLLKSHSNVSQKMESTDKRLSETISELKSMKSTVEKLKAEKSQLEKQVIVLLMIHKVRDFTEFSRIIYS